MMRGTSALACGVSARIGTAHSVAMETNSETIIFERNMNESRCLKQGGPAAPPPRDQGGIIAPLPAGPSAAGQGAEQAAAGGEHEGVGVPLPVRTSDCPRGGFRVSNRYNSAEGS